MLIVSVAVLCIRSIDKPLQELGWFHTIQYSLQRQRAVGERFDPMNIVLTSTLSISVIIPLYDGEAFLADAIESLLGQALPQLSTAYLRLIKQTAAQPRGTL